MRKDGSILIITLVIITIMMGLTLGVAQTTFVNINNASSYADSQIAKDTAKAGIADLMERLANGDQPENVLINMDTDTKENLSVKKAPSARYYSFTQQEKIKVLGRCAKVAIISPWDPATATYLKASGNALDLIFKKLNDRNNALSNSGIQGFQNPLTAKNDNGTDTNLASVPDYWYVKMGGPLDQWDNSTQINPSDISANKKIYTGLFSNPGFEDYDLLYFPLPPNRVLRLDDSTKGSLQNWLNNGGRMWIDNPGASALVNAPFTTNGDYKFNWDYANIRYDNSVTDSSAVGQTDYEVADNSNPTTFFQGDGWILDDAFNAADGLEHSLKWSKLPNILSGYSNFGINVLRYGPMDSLTYPGSTYSTAVDRSKAIDTSLIADQKIYFKYGTLKNLAIGDNIRIPLQQNAPPSAPYIKGTIQAIDYTENSITLYSSNNKMICNAIDSIPGQCAVPDSNNMLPFSDHLGSLVAIDTKNGWDVEYFNREVARRNSNSTTTDPNFSLNGSTFSIDAQGKATLAVKDIRQYALGRFVEIVPTDTNNLPMWGTISLISFSGSISGDPRDQSSKVPGSIEIINIKTGPIPRYGHNFVYDKAYKRAFLFGGYSLDENSTNGICYSQKHYQYLRTSASENSIMSASNCTARNDVWMLDLSGVSPVWKLIKKNTPNTNLLINRDNMTIPLPRAYATAAVMNEGSSSSLIIAFGETVDWGSTSWLLDDSDAGPLGNKKYFDGSSSTLADVWVLKNAQDTALAYWQPRAGLNTVPKRTDSSQIDGNFLRETVSHYNPNNQGYRVDNANDLILNPPFGPTRRTTGSPDDLLNEKADSVTFRVKNNSINKSRMLNGVAVGDVIRLYKNNKYVDGTIFSMALNSDPNFVDVKVDALYGTDEDYRGASFTVIRHANQMAIESNIKNNSTTVGDLAVGDVVKYVDKDNSSNQYWGKVGSISYDTPGSKIINPLFSGPVPRTRAGGIYVDSMDQSLYVFGGRVRPDGGDELNDTWRIKNILTGSSGWESVETFTPSISSDPVDVTVTGRATTVAQGPAGEVSVGDKVIYLQSNFAEGIGIGDTLNIASSANVAMPGLLYGKITNIMSQFEKNLKIEFSDGLKLNRGESTLGSENQGAAVSADTSPGYTKQVVISGSGGVYQFNMSGSKFAIGDTVKFMVGSMTLSGKIENINWITKIAYLRSNVSAAPMARYNFATLPEISGDNGGSSDMVIFGGIRAYGWRSNDIWKATISGNTVFWSEVKAPEIGWTHEVSDPNLPTPFWRNDATGAYDSNKSKIVMFGGARDAGRTRYERVWTYSINNKKWSSRYKIGQFGQDKPTGRSSTQAIVIPDKDNNTKYKMLIYGGNSSYPVHYMHYSWRNLNDISSPSDLDKANQEFPIGSDVKAWNGDGSSTGKAKDGTFLRLSHAFFNEIFRRTGNSDYKIDYANTYKSSAAFPNIAGNPTGLISALRLGSSSGWSGNDAGLNSLGSKFTTLTTFPCNPDVRNDKTGVVEDNYLIDAEGVCSLGFSAVANVGSNSGLMLLTSDNVGLGTTNYDRYGDLVMSENRAFLYNVLIYMQTRNRIKVTGYYGGVARAFLVTLGPNYEPLETVEVQADP